MKKAQMQINETIIVLFIFFMLLVFGILFFAKFQKGNYDIQKKASQELEIIKLSQTITKLPELAYSYDNALRDYIDVMKMDNFSIILNSNPDYFTGTPLYYTKITIKPYDPFHGDEGTPGVPKVIYDKPLEGSSNKTMRIPVLLYDKRTDETSFAVLELLWYVK